MTMVARTVIDSNHDGYYTEEEPRDAAALIIIDRSVTEAKVLLGRRHMRHVFLPGKFVFPGGRVDATDWDMPAAKLLHPDTTRKLLVDTKLWSEMDAQALALAAIRETFEETGMVIGTKGWVAGDVPAGPWAKFVRTGYYPDPSVLQLIARAITPPGFPQRFDARFFCADASAIAHQLQGAIHAEAELVELTWLPITAAKNLNLPIITRLVLQELQSRLHAGLTPDLPVAFYCTRDGEFTRLSID
jgi:8-oxo-dGTP pyrophosphatase MutT (NUDIX family)